MPLLRQLLPRDSGSVLVKFAVVIPSHKLHLVYKHGGREGRASSSIVSVVVCYNAPLQLTGEVRRGTLIMRVLSAHAPPTSLPQRTQVLGVIGTRLVALEAIRKDRFLRMTVESLPKYGASVSIIVLVVSWPLTGENVGNVDTGGGEYGGW